MNIVRRSICAAEDDLPPCLHPVLRRVYLGRNLRCSDELNHDLSRLIPASKLEGTEAAAELLHTTLTASGRILVVGDFDADGATSCALAIRVLRRLGAADVQYLVPNRFEYGYGLTPEIVRLAADRRPDLIVTVDNGISSCAGVAAAREMGVPVLVTDHHLPGPEMPDAAVIVNPNQPGSGFPSRQLAGVGVIFYVLLALRARLRAQGWFRRRNIPEPNMAEVLDLVALGTVADVVGLDYNNRILVDQGLRRIRAGRCCAGIGALLAVSGRSRERAVASDLGFAVGPRLNAAGRLHDMSLGIECLLTDDPARAADIARQLDALNRERRGIEAGMQKQATQVLADLEKEPEQSMPYSICLYHEEWHQGVIGILASRIKERFHRPVIAFADAGNGMLKGSARSIPGLHIRDTLDRVAARHPGLLKRFGGHAMAAGLSLELERLAAFTQAFDEEVKDMLDPSALCGEILSDGELLASDLNIDLACILRNAGPWGQAFQEPLFDGEFSVLSQRIVGGKHLKMHLAPTGGGVQIDAIAFNQADSAPDYGRVHLAYRLDVNEFRGSLNAQLVVEDIQAASKPTGRLVT